MVMTYPTPSIQKGPLCLCGCGQHLPVNSNRKYKRGHRQNVNRRESQRLDRELGIDRSRGQFDGYNFQREPIPELQSDPYEFTGNSDRVEFAVNDADGSFISMEDAMANTPKDPESSLFTTDDKGQPIEITRAVLKDVEGKLAFMLGTSAGLFNVMDPVCGGAALSAVPGIAKSLTPIICQSPGIVAWFQKTSNIILYINLAMACWPVASAIYTHHFAKHADKVPNDFVQNGDFNINPDMYGVS